MEHFFWVSFGQSFWFAWFTVHILYLSGSSHASLNQDGSYQRGVWVEHPLTWFPLASNQPFLPMCDRRDLQTLKNMWSGRGPAPSLNCPAILLLKFQSVESKSPITFPCGEEGSQVPPASKLGTKAFRWGRRASHSDFSVCTALGIPRMGATWKSNGVNEWERRGASLLKAQCGKFNQMVENLH